MERARDRQIWGELDGELGVGFDAPLEEFAAYQPRPGIDTGNRYDAAEQSLTATRDDRPELPESERT